MTRKKIFAVTALFLCFSCAVLAVHISRKNRLLPDISQWKEVTIGYLAEDHRITVADVSVLQDIKDYAESGKGAELSEPVHDSMPIQTTIACNDGEMIYILYFEQAGVPYLEITRGSETSYLYTDVEFSDYLQKILN